jgi:hypothetical protein
MTGRPQLTGSLRDPSRGTVFTVGHGGSEQAGPAAGLHVKITRLAPFRRRIRTSRAAWPRRTKSRLTGLAATWRPAAVTT